MALFTGAYTNPLASSPDTTMQAATDTTQATLSLAGSPNVDNLAMTVVMITGTEGTVDHPWAGLRVYETRYAASMVKIAAMYAAFDMRSSARASAARQLLARLGVTVADLQDNPDDSRVPTVAEYLPQVLAAAEPGARRTYNLSVSRSCWGISRVDSEKCL